ncbi:hypothetical protein IRJ41_004986 [Triplophysa rosa]|uniref:Uncharacterized protein n=1 Tax=Triplophysa rosa TaxID=992332 RepID=A0A9W7TKF0_TRIRA|nr:hypothetical protein IRJ41_004986 [Triplophysa rosa]
MTRSADGWRNGWTETAGWRRLDDQLDGRVEERLDGDSWMERLDGEAGWRRRTDGWATTAPVHLRRSSPSPSCLTVEAFLDVKTLTCVVCRKSHKAAKIMGCNCSKKTADPRMLVSGPKDHTFATYTTKYNLSFTRLRVQGYSLSDLTESGNTKELNSVQVEGMHHLSDLGIPNIIQSQLRQQPPKTNKCSVSSLGSEVCLVDEGHSPL